MAIPNINELPCRPLLQTLASKEAWVKVEFFRADIGPTKAEIYRTIELLCMTYNGWEDPPALAEVQP